MGCKQRNCGIFPGRAAATYAGIKADFTFTHEFMNSTFEFAIAVDYEF